MKGLNSFDFLKSLDFRLIFFELTFFFKHQFYPKGEYKSLRKYDGKSVGQSCAQKLDFKKSGNDSKTELKML